MAEDTEDTVSNLEIARAELVALRAQGEIETPPEYLADLPFYIAAHKRV